MCVHAQSLSHVWLFATLGTVACRAPLSIGFPRQEYWSGLPFPSPGDFPDPGISCISWTDRWNDNKSKYLLPLDSFFLCPLVLPKQTSNALKNHKCCARKIRIKPSHRKGAGCMHRNPSFSSYTEIISWMFIKYLFFLYVFKPIS